MQIILDDATKINPTKLLMSRAADNDGVCFELFNGIEARMRIVVDATDLINSALTLIKKGDY